MLKMMIMALLISGSLTAHAQQERQDYNCLLGGAAGQFKNVVKLLAVKDSEGSVLTTASVQLNQVLVAEGYFDDVQGLDKSKAISKLVCSDKNNVRLCSKKAGNSSISLEMSSSYGSLQATVNGISLGDCTPQ